MTVEDLIREGRIAGIDFWGIYDWTWGEISDFIFIQHEKERRRLKEQANLSYINASIIARMISGDGKRIDPVKEYSHLYTDEELKEIKIARLKSKLKKPAVVGEQNGS